MGKVSRWNVINIPKLLRTGRGSSPRVLTGSESLQSHLMMAARWGLLLPPGKA